MIAKGNQAITFASTAPTGATVGGATYAVSATTNGSLVVAFSSATPAVLHGQRQHRVDGRHGHLHDQRRPGGRYQLEPGGAGAAELHRRRGGRSHCLAQLLLGLAWRRIDGNADDHAHQSQQLGHAEHLAAARRHRAAQPRERCAGRELWRQRSGFGRQLPVQPLLRRTGHLHGHAQLHRHHPGFGLGLCARGIHAQRLSDHRRDQ